MKYSMQWKELSADVLKDNYGMDVSECQNVPPKHLLISALNVEMYS